MRLRARRVAASLALGLLPALGWCCPTGLRLAFNDGDFRPMINGSGPQFGAEPGWLVLAVRQTLKALDCKAELLRLPSRRIEVELEQGKLGFGLLFGYTAQRSASLSFPLDLHGRPDPGLAIVATRLVLFTLPDRAETLGWDGRRVAPGRRIGVVQGNTQHQIAQSMGLPVEAFSSPESGLAMLRAGRFDALLMSPEGLPPEEQGPTPAGGPLRELSPPVQQVLYYAVAAPALRERHPGFVQDFWRGLCNSLRASANPALPAGCSRPAAKAERQR